MLRRTALARLQTLPRVAGNKNKIDYAVLNRGGEGALPFDDPRHWRPIMEKLRDPSPTAAAVAAAGVDKLQVVPFSELAPERVVEAIEILGVGFAQKEPMCRFIRPPALPQPCADSLHDKFGFRDAFSGSDSSPSDKFGPWSRESLMKAFVRRFVLTDPTSSTGGGAIPALNEAAMRHSVAAVDPETGAVKFAIACDTMAPSDAPPPVFRGPDEDPAVAAVFSYISPVLGFLDEQEQGAKTALCAASPEFAAALAGGRVWTLFMIAKTPDITAEGAGELLRRATAKSIEPLSARADSDDAVAAFGFSEATNEWTVRQLLDWDAQAVHYLRFQSKPRLAKSATPLDNEASSENGFLSNFDTGSVGFAFKLK